MAVTERSQLHRYRVRRWTDFTWKRVEPDQRAHLEKMAKVITRKLTTLYPQGRAACVMTRDRNHRPQLMFAITVEAETGEEAAASGVVSFNRVMTVTGRDRTLRLDLPWGSVECDHEWDFGVQR